MGLTREEIFVLKTLHKKTTDSRTIKNGFITNLLSRMGYDSDEVTNYYWLYINNRRNDGNYKEITEPDRRGNLFMGHIMELGKKPWEEIGWKNADEWITDQAYPDTEEVTFDDRNQKIVFWLNTENLAQEFLEIGDEGYYSLLDASSTEADDHLESDERCYIPYSYTDDQLQRFKDIYTYFGNELKITHNGVVDTDSCQHDDFFRVIGAENYWDDFCDQYHYEYKSGQLSEFSREVYRILEEAQIEEHGNMWAVVLTYDQFKELASTKQPEDWEEVFGGMFEDWRQTATLYDMSVYDFSPDDEEGMITEVDDFLDRIDEWIEENTDIKDSIIKFNKIAKDLGLTQMYIGNSNYAFGKNKGDIIAGIKKVNMDWETVEIDIFADKDARTPKRKVSAKFDEISRWFTMPALINEVKVSPKFQTMINSWITKQGGSEYVDGDGDGYIAVCRDMGKKLGLSLEEILLSISRWYQEAWKSNYLKFDRSMLEMYEMQDDFDVESKTFKEYLDFIVKNDLINGDDLDADEILLMFYYRWKYRKSDDTFWEDFHSKFWMKREELSAYTGGPCNTTDDYGFYVDDWDDLAPMFDDEDNALNALGEEYDPHFGDYTYSLSEVYIDGFSDVVLDFIKDKIIEVGDEIMVWDEEQGDEIMLTREMLDSYDGDNIESLLKEEANLSEIADAIRFAYSDAATQDMHDQWRSSYRDEIINLFGEPTWDQVGPPAKKLNSKGEKYIPNRLVFKIGQEEMAKMILENYGHYDEWSGGCEMWDLWREENGDIRMYDQDFYPDVQDDHLMDQLEYRFEDIT